MTIFDLYPKGELRVIVRDTRKSPHYTDHDMIGTTSVLAKYHFLVLPRLPLVLPANTFPPDKIDFFPIDLASLSSLLRLNRHKPASESFSPPLLVLEKMKEAAEDCVAMVKDEMVKTEGFCWDVWVGFHAVPSMK
jgi:hypothetical protein